jgi:predicted  nucleic acid-binding Zn-ribbon protein
MCLNCGCGKPNDRHKQGDIVLDDLKQAAQNHDMQVEEAADNIHRSAKELKEQGAIS